MKASRVRPYTTADARPLVSLVRALARYENLAPLSGTAAKRLIRDVGKRIHVLLAEVQGEAVGYAMYFFAYSSFRARPTLYIEDLFVLPSHRREGLGRALFSALLKVARRERCGRMEWIVLDWNRTARGFYRRMGARPLKGWIPYRISF